MIKVYDRNKQRFYIEKEYGAGKLSFLYTHIIGRILLKAFFCGRLYSRINGFMEKTRSSRKKIKPFIEKFHIDMRLYEKRNYRSFDDFFTRKKKESYLQVDMKKDTLISPCDGKLQIFPIDNELRLKIKGSSYRLWELLDDKIIVDRYKGGMALVYRLSADDYHRYCYIDSGKLLLSKVIKGKLHTVRPIARSENVFRQNQREYVVLDADNLGEHIYMEVGALQIGKINNFKVHKFKKGQEKGYFSHGASTIIVIVPQGSVIIDNDIVEMSRKNIEVKVHYGEKVGNIRC